MTVRPALALASVLLLAACGPGTVDSSGSGGPSDNRAGMTPVRSFASVAGTYWGRNATGPRPMVASEQAIEVHDKGFRIWVGCNVIEVTARVKDRLLVVDSLTTTDLACAPELMAQDEWLADYLTKSPQIDAGGPMLGINWNEGWLGFEKSERAFPGPGPSPSAPSGSAAVDALREFEGMYQSSNLAKAPRPMAPVTVGLSIGGDAPIPNAGCNTMSGRASIVGGRLVFAEPGLMMTEMGCEAPLMKQDAWLAGLLASKTTTIERVADKLILGWPDGAIEFTRTGDVLLPSGDPDEPVVGTPSS